MKKMFVPILLLLMIAGCTKNESKSYPDCGISQEHMNNEISVFNAKENNKILGSIVFVVKNNTNEEIMTSWDFDVEIFSYDYSNQVWEQVKNNAIYLGEDIYDDQLLEKSYFGIDPDIPINQEKARIYVCLFGRLVKSNELVGASSILLLD